MTDRIHPTAVVEPGAKIGVDVSIGPYCCVGAEVELGDNVLLDSHVVVGGRTRIGAGSRVFPFASVGLPPQDMKYAGEASELIIGENNIIREHVTMNPGTSGGGMVTRVGNRCLFMAGAHVAHDCQIGDNVIMVNNTVIGGHVEIGDFAIIGGMSAVLQFVRIGAHAMIGGMSGVDKDVIPFGSVNGNRAQLVGLNLIGLKRRGFCREDINELRQAYRSLFGKEGTLQLRLEGAAQAFADCALVQEVVEFIRNSSAHGICQPNSDVETL